ncbi:hypothetical protein JZ751_012303, partial [Albula glossodonta]
MQEPPPPLKNSHSPDCKTRPMHTNTQATRNMHSARHSINQPTAAVNKPSTHPITASVGTRFTQENASVACHESAHLPRPPLLLFLEQRPTKHTFIQLNKLNVSRCLITRAFLRTAILTDAWRFGWHLDRSTPTSAPPTAPFLPSSPLK